MRPNHRTMIKLLGAPAVVVDGRTTVLRERRAVCLLAYLADLARPVPRDEAATLLWPDVDPDTSRTRLRRLIYKINTSAVRPLISSDRLSICLTPPAVVDSVSFMTLLEAGDTASALALWNGQFLDGIDLTDSDTFSEWLFFRREALNGRYLHALEREIDKARQRGDFASAVTLGRRLVAMDPLDEAAHRQVIAACLDLGDRLAAKAQYDLLAGMLESALGLTPSRETQALFAASKQRRIDLPKTHYTRADDVHIAWQAYGSGPVDIVVVPGFVSHVERMWDEENSRRWLERAGRLGRLILFDRRGVGLSDRIGSAPTVEATARDIGAVMEAAGCRRVVLFGASEGGPGCVSFTVDHPARVAALILWGSLPKGSRSDDFPAALTPDQFDQWLDRLIAQWGGPAELELFAPTLASSVPVAQWWASLLRAGSSPGGIRSVLHALRDMDVRTLLPKVQVPTLIMHRKGDRAVRPQASLALAESIPGAELRLLDGNDHWFWAGAQEEQFSAIAELILAIQRLSTPE